MLTRMEIMNFRTMKFIDSFCNCGPSPIVPTMFKGCANHCKEVELWEVWLASHSLIFKQYQQWKIPWLIIRCEFMEDGMRAAGTTSIPRHVCGCMDRVIGKKNVHRCLRLTEGIKYISFSSSMYDFYV